MHINTYVIIRIQIQTILCIFILCGFFACTLIDFSCICIRCYCSAQVQFSLCSHASYTIRFHVDTHVIIMLFKVSGHPKNIVKGQKFTLICNSFVHILSCICRGLFEHICFTYVFYTFYIQFSITYSSATYFSRRAKIVFQCFIF